MIAKVWLSYKNPKQCQIDKKIWNICKQLLIMLLWLKFVKILASNNGKTEVWIKQYTF